MKNISVNGKDFIFSPRFNKMLQETPEEIKAALVDALSLFVVEPHHPALRNHPLQGKYAGFRSIDVTADYRALFREDQPGERIVFTFYLIGTHHELYG